MISGTTSQSASGSGRAAAANDGSTTQFNAVARLELEQGLRENEDAAIGRRYARTVLIGVAALAVVCAALGTIVYTLSSHPTSGISVPDEFQAHFSAQAVETDTQSASFVESQPAYSGVMHKRLDADGKWVFDGTLTFTEDNNRTEVTMVNNRAYFTLTDTTTGELLDSGCVTSENLPLWQDLEEAFDSASSLPDHEEVVGRVEQKCAGRHKYVVDWGGMMYIFCALSGSQDSFQFVGEEFTADIFNIKTDNFVDIPIPESTKGEALSCPELESPASSRLLRHKRRRLTSMPLVTSEDAGAASHDDPWFLQREQDARDARKRNLKSKKACIFMHGLGHGENLSSGSRHDYWGDVHKWAKCSSYTFIKRDTKHVAFDDDSLSNHICSQAGAANGGTITNKIIFTHSMGNLILAAALEKGTCSIGRGTEWYQVQGPLKGAKAAQVATSFCSSSALGWLARALGFCDGASIQSLLPSYTQYSKYASIINQKVYGGMCGRSDWGLTTMYSVPLVAAHNIVGFGEDSDGVVGWSSCNYNMPASWNDNYKTRFYKPSVNHLDGTCRNGNGWIPWWGGGEHRQPCRWFEWVTKH